MSPERDSSPLPLDLYQGRSVGEAATLGQDGGACATSEERDATTHAISKNNNNSSSNKNTTSSGGGIASGTSTQTAHHNNGNGDNKSRRRDDSDDEDDDEPHHGIVAMDSPPARPGSCSVLDVVEKIEEPDSYDEEMDLDDDVEDNSSNDAMGLNMKIGAAISHTAAALALPSPLGGGSGGGGGDPESARSTPAAATSSTSCGGLILASDLTHQQQRATSRSPRDAANIERPGSSGVCGLASTSAGMSPSSSAAAAAAGSDALAGTSGLGPVQSVPLVSFER